MPRVSSIRPKPVVPDTSLAIAADEVGNTISSVSDFLSKLSELNFTDRNLWFRGIGNAKYELIPSLFRNQRAKNQASCKALELDLNETFQMRSVPYTGSNASLSSEWDRLFYMQHYRVPTRLLDWSGSPLVALHFALTSAKIAESGAVSSDVAVWVLDPVAWNAAAFADTGFLGGVLTTRDSWLTRYSPSQVYTHASALFPVALRGVHNSPRIVAQQGYFTVFGPRAESMEKSFSTTRDDGVGYFPSDCLKKFTIPKELVADMKKEIFALGISEATIYPDLEGLAAELKRTFGFQ